MSRWASRTLPDLRRMRIAAGRTRVPLLVLACSVLSGCFWTAYYPGDWPQFDAPVAAGCPDLSGRYASVGISAYARQQGWDNQTESLTRLFFDEPLGAVTQIAISQPDARSIRVEEIEADVILQARELTIDRDHSCREAKVWLTGWTPLAEGAYDPFPLFVLGAERYRIGLVRTADGSLLGELHSKGAALAVVIPMIGGENDFVLWQAVD